MNEGTEKKQGRLPDFTGNLPVAAWKNTTKDGETYLSVVIGGVLKMNLFKNKPKPKPKVEDF